jgi:hypothetical protein
LRPLPLGDQEFVCGIEVPQTFPTTGSVATRPRCTVNTVGLDARSDVVAPYAVTVTRPELAEVVRKYKTRQVVILVLQDGVQDLATSDFPLRFHQ